ncbi:caspase family protein, partial [Salinisphaera sp. USBA-960]|nr:caspase family protein [Salifodinibacter halophilus]
MRKPGVEIRKFFGLVRDDVTAATSNAQEPFVYGSLSGDDYF